MNFSVSPDIDALYCYVIVFVLGAAASLYQLWTNLGGLLGVWAIIDAWTVFAVYSVVPVALFWLLDRTGAISDTSVFAAVLVGLAYQQVLSGQSSLQGPAEAASFWKFLAVWTASMLPRIRDRMATNNARFKEATITSVSADTALFGKLNELALYLSSDTKSLQAQLTAIEDQKKQLGDNVVAEKQAKVLYEAVGNDGDFKYLLWKHGVIDWKNYLWFAREYRSKAIGWAVLIATAAILGAGYWYIEQPQFLARYYVWRLEKSQASKQDRFRTQQALLAMMSRCKPGDIFEKTAAALQNDSFAPEVVGRVTDILIEGQASAQRCNVDLVGLTLNGLRNSDPDSRARVQAALTYIAGLQNVTVPDGFAGWHPSSHDSADLLDSWIRKWQSASAKNASSAAPSSSKKLASAVSTP